MEEELIKITEYVIDREIVQKCAEEGRNLTKQDVECELQDILRKNEIECKTKLNEEWTPKVSKYASSKYNLIAEVYVHKEDYERAKEIIEKN